MQQNRNTARPSLRMGLPGILLRAALVLLCLTLLCVHLMGSLFGKYSSTVTGSASARVAKFQVDIEEVDPVNNVTIQCETADSDDHTYIFRVVNSSEVAVKYYVTVQCEPVVKGVMVCLDGDTGELAGNLWTMPGTFSLAPDSTSADHALAFAVDWADFTEDVTGATAAGSFTFTVTVHIEQVN